MIYSQMCSTTSGQLSPGGSVSSASSLEANSPALAMEQQLSPSIAAKPPMTIRFEMNAWNLMTEFWKKIYWWNYDIYNFMTKNENHIRISVR